MVKQMRDLVKSGYNEGNYDDIYSRKNMNLEPFEKFTCDELSSRLKTKAKILDLGCGVGLPYDAYFIKNGFSVTGVDISERHIELAKKNVKLGKFFVGDFFTNQVKGKFDAIVSFYAIFHIPRNEHEKLLKRICSLLNKNGYILITLGTDSMKCDVDKDFVGAPMAWSSYSVEKNKKLIRDVGFDIILAAEDYRTERHLWILAKKK